MRGRAAQLWSLDKRWRVHAITTCCIVRRLRADRRVQLDQQLLLRLHPDRITGSTRRPPTRSDSTRPWLARPLRSGAISLAPSGCHLAFSQGPAMTTPRFLAVLAREMGARVAAPSRSAGTHLAGGVAPLRGPSPAYESGRRSGEPLFPPPTHHEQRIVADFTGCDQRRVQLCATVVFAADTTPLDHAGTVESTISLRREMPVDSTRRRTSTAQPTCSHAQSSSVRDASAVEPSSVVERSDLTTSVDWSAADCQTATETKTKRVYFAAMCHLPLLTDAEKTCSSRDQEKQRNRSKSAAVAAEVDIPALQRIQDVAFYRDAKASAGLCTR